ncbi:MAG: hypothetical protein ACOCUS_06615 [Polyangiales bacterium]
MATAATETPTRAPIEATRTEPTRAPRTAPPRLGTARANLALVVMIPVTFAIAMGLSVWLGSMSY